MQELYSRQKRLQPVLPPVCSALKAARILHYCVSKAARFITGAAIPVDGGLQVFHIIRRVCATEFSY